MEAVEAHFVELTKAYKSLTDEEIRNNLEKYGHPDGKQEFSMGLALPTWVVESKNNFWVLGAYGLLFAGLLPMLVVRNSAVSHGTAWSDIHAYRVAGGSVHGR